MRRGTNGGGVEGELGASSKAVSPAVGGLDDLKRGPSLGNAEEGGKGARRRVERGAMKV